MLPKPLTIRYILLAIAVLSMILVFPLFLDSRMLSCLRSDQTEEVPSNRDIPTISSASLSLSFDRNPANAEQSFTSRLLHVRGIIESPKPDTPLLGRFIPLLESPSHDTRIVRVFCEPDDPKRFLDRVSAGDVVTVQGVILGIDFVDGIRPALIINSCELVASGNLHWQRTVQ